MRPALVFALLAMFACGDAVDDDPLRFSSSGCLRPIEDLCRDDRCRTYEEELRHMEEYAPSACRQPLATIRSGMCGELRFITNSHAFGGQTTYYDASGRVVARSVGTDAAGPGGCFTYSYGFSPRCEPYRVTRDLCAR